MANDKLYGLLAVTDSLAVSFKNMLKDYINFFKNNQGAFTGEKKTYTPAGDAVDEPKHRGNRLVQTTVDEKFEWFVENTEKYLKTLFDQEATNASGMAVADLIVDGKDFGTYSSLELLRLKSILENGDLLAMYGLIPVRSDAEEWNKTVEENYKDRAIYENPMLSWDNKTTEKESYILTDPNLDKIGDKNYTPQLGTKNTTRLLGHGTTQKFSGEWSQRQRATALKRIKLFHIGVVEALKKANDVEIRSSVFDPKKFFDYINQG